MPEINAQLPETPDNAWKDLQFRFDGRWIPDVDGSLIGPNNYADIQNLRYRDSGLEGVNGYSKINTTTLDDHATLGDYPKIRNGHQLRSDRTTNSYVLVHALGDSDQGRVFLNTTTIGTQGNFDTTVNFDVSGNPYFADSSTGLDGRFSDAPRETLTYANSEDAMIYSGAEQAVAALFAGTDEGSSPAWAPTNPVDYTEEVSNDLTTDYVTFATGANDTLLVMTTRPIQGIKLYITGTPVTGAPTVKYWAGSSWTAVSNPSDGTSGLTTTGTITFDHTNAVCKLKHFEELYLYAYVVSVATASATANIYKVTVDPAFQPVKNVWDGVYRQPIQCQYNDAAQVIPYEDYTAHVNVASDVDNPVALDLDGGSAFDTTGEILLMFNTPQAAIRFQLLGKYTNTAASTLTLKYWNGSAYAAPTGTVDTSNGMRQSGLLSWDPNTAEKPRTLFNSFGYVYQITTGTQFAGVTDGTTNRVYVDLITGVPAQKNLKAYDFPSQYGTRVMWCSPSILNEGNRIDFSAANAPDVYNGTDSSNDGTLSLYFGGAEKITAATGLYNRFGSSILSLFLVLKDAETYLLVGDTPEDFVIYPVSKSIGCPAPLTLATGEVNLSKKPTEGATRNIAMWLSASGPVMFDGASISSVRGIENYFDPSRDEYIDWDYISQCRGWMDNTYKEYNLLIPSSSGQTTNNKWLVYDLLRRKWTRKDPGSAGIPQSAWEVKTTSGERKNYGGLDTGYMMYLENGNNWDGTGIRQRIKTGDFFPSSNIWDETLIRKFKLLTHKFENSSSSNSLDIYYYSNTEDLIGSGITFVDSTDGLTGVNVDFQDTIDAAGADTDEVDWAATSSVTIDVNQDIGSRRIISVVTDENRLAWAHAYEFDITTTDVARGFRPIAWGVRYRVERKDDQATQ